jgi:hypothetical protein
MCERSERAIKAEFHAIDFEHGVTNAFSDICKDVPCLDVKARRIGRRLLYSNNRQG